MGYGTRPWGTSPTPGSRGRAPDWDQLRPEVQRFALLMEARLRYYDEAKGVAGWKSDPVTGLFDHLLSEVIEVQQLLEGGAGAEQYGEELADVGNMAMMIADAVGALG